MTTPSTGIDDVTPRPTVWTTGRIIEKDLPHPDMVRLRMHVEDRQRHWPGQHYLIRLRAPDVQTSGGSFGVRTNRFGFNITGTSGLVIVVEACTNLANPSWSPVGTNTLTGGSSYFSDPQWTNYPARFYRLRSP